MITIVPDNANTQTNTNQLQTNTIPSRIQLSPGVAYLLQQAWEVRIANFPMEITCVTPTKTKPISVTGEDCALNCSHCGRHYLKGMQSLEMALGTAGETTCVLTPKTATGISSKAALGQGNCSSQGTEKPQSYLISGGCTPQGKVPILPHINKLYHLKKDFRLNVHPGLVNKEEAKALAAVAEVASFDFVSSKEIIQQVYGLDKNLSDYISSYRYLVESFGVNRVVPHITIGLAKGEVTNEAEAVQILASEGISRLVLLVLRPTPGTRFGGMEPPAVEDVAGLMAQIRRLIPQIPVYLGCMRPGGSYRNRLDSIAVKCGINKIVQPAKSFQPVAKQLGLEIIYEEECCSL